MSLRSYRVLGGSNNGDPPDIACLRNYVSIRSQASLSVVAVCHITRLTFSPSTSPTRLTRSRRLPLTVNENWHTNRQMRPSHLTSKRTRGPASRLSISLSGVLSSRRHVRIPFNWKGYLCTTWNASESRDTGPLIARCGLSTQFAFLHATSYHI